MEKPTFEAFYGEYLQRVYKFVFFRVGGNRTLAEDLTQDVFLKVFEAYDRYDPEKSRSAWVYTIARNHLINYFQKQRPGVELEEIEDTAWVSVDVRASYASRHESEALYAAIQELPSDDAQLIRMKHLEGWSFEDLAGVFEKTPASLRTQSSRAMKKLKHIVKQKPRISPPQASL